jgi:hypothetical protein
MGKDSQPEKMPATLTQESNPPINPNPLLKQPMERSAKPELEKRG